MEIFHQEEILRRFPDAKNKAHLLKTFQLGSSEADYGRPGIPDPIGKPMEVYEVCCAEIRKAVERVVTFLKTDSS